MRFADWSEAEIHDLRWAAHKGRSFDEVAQYLGRPTADIERKARELGIVFLTPSAWPAGQGSDRA